MRMANRGSTLLLAGLVAVASALIDTHTWAGAEYTPAKAPGNSLWWALYDDYASDVNFELGQLSKRYGFNVLRMFMHSSVFDLDNGRTLLTNVDKFLTLATSHGFQAGLVFFDDCWAGSCPNGCNATVPCVPTKGRHNGCWVQSPYMADRTNVTRFQPYVQAVVNAFKADPRVLYWEVYNEPRNSDPFSMSLRTAGYSWITALQPQQPVLSCWDDNTATQAVDSHHYDTDFAALSSQVYQNPTKGGAITEGGSRWFQGYGLGGDAGSPKTFVTWLNNIRSITPSANAPFQFGLLQNWAMMVGLDNTRWHWNTPDGAPEPTIPWDSHMFPDGTPISHTEAALIRNWTLARNDFLGYAGFLPQAWNYQGDSFVQLPSGTGWVLGSDSVVSRRTGQVAVDRAGSLFVPAGSMTDFVAEATLWPSNNTGGGVLLRAGVSPSTGEMTGYFVGFRNTGGAHPLLVAETWGVDGSVTPLASPFDMSTLDCGLVINGWNILRASIATNATSGMTVIQAWANSMFPGTYGRCPTVMFPAVVSSLA